MTRIDREGIFKAQPVAWGLSDKKDGSEARAIVIDWRILAQLGPDGEWVDWSTYEEYIATGYHYVIKKDGTLNTGKGTMDGTVEQLAKSIGWDGSLVLPVDPPDVVAQISVKAESYDGKTSFKVAWVNPGDYTPKPRTATPEDAKAANNRYGSLLRAATASAKAKAPAPAKAPATAPKPLVTPEGARGDDGLPF